MKYKLYRAKRRNIEGKPNLDKDFTFSGEYEANMKSDLNFKLAKNYKTDETVRPIMVGDIVVDSLGKKFLFTETLLWAELE